MSPELAIPSPRRKSSLTLLCELHQRAILELGRGLEHGLFASLHVACDRGQVGDLFAWRHGHFDGPVVAHDEHDRLSDALAQRDGKTVVLVVRDNRAVFPSRCASASRFTAKSSFCCSGVTGCDRNETLAVI